ncbi:MAG: fibronectin type III domain-containing protein, partial [Clostridia bacterium]|nr:fibronectin type III domain-containing protein [Clostridia bacterium]
MEENKMKKFIALITVLITMICASAVFAGAANTTASVKTTAKEIIMPSRVYGLKQKSAGAASVTLTWNKAYGASGYKVYKYNSTKKKYVELTKTAKNTVTVSSLSAGKTYKFKVCAYNANGKGEYSSVLTAYTAPGKVTSLKNAAATASTVKLTWKKVTAATGYKVYKYNSTSKKYALYKSTAETSLKISSLKAKTNYKFYVTAYRTVGGATYTGAKSAVLLTGTSTAAPAVSSAAGSSVTAAKITFKAVSGAAGYQAQLSTSKSFSSVVSKTGTKSPITVTGLNPGKTYYVRLRTYRTVNDSKIYSPFSTVKSFKLADAGVDIAQSSKKIYTGCKAYLTSKVNLSSVTLKWTSSDTKIATVKANGKTGCAVTAKKAGTVTVTASFVYKNKTYKDTCK